MADKMIYDNKSSYVVNENPEDKPGCFLNAVSFFFPLVGIILYFVMKGEKPKAAKSCLNYALRGIAFAVVIYIVNYMTIK